jgi:photosystem II stability/assembly factor-like uncharacterized protein
MKRIFILAILIFVCIFANAQWVIQTSNTVNILNNVFFVDAKIGWAVGDGGIILKSINGGGKWVRQASNTTNALHAVYFVSPTTGVAGGDLGTMLRTTNGGTTWQPVTFDLSNNVQSIHFTDVITGYAVGENGMIKKTFDGGLTWVDQSSGTTYQFNAVNFPNLNTGFAVGNVNGTAIMVKTINGGSNWIELNSGVSQPLNSIFFTDETTGFAVGVGGTFLKTIDGGSTWTSSLPFDAETLTCIYFVNSNTGYVTSINGSIGKIHKTTDGGNTWTSETIPSANPLWSIHLPRRPNICLIDYGYHDDSAPNADLTAIKAARPEILIDNTPGGYWGSGTLPKEYTPLGIQVFSYITGGYEGTKYLSAEDNLTSNIARVGSIAADAATGVFLDEVSSILNDAGKTYISAIFDECRAKGLKLILNTGWSVFDPWLMTHCDFLMSDEQYAGARIPTDSELPYASRLLVVAYNINNATDAAQITQTAHIRGFGYSYACKAYTSLPTWLGDYITALTPSLRCAVGSEGLIINDNSIDTGINDSIGTGINDNKANNTDSRIFPNPASDHINIKNADNDVLEINIYDVVGKLVNSKMYQQNQSISTSGLDNGIYLVEIKSKKWLEKQKLIIQR